MDHEHHGKWEAVQEEALLHKSNVMQRQTDTCTDRRTDRQTDIEAKGKQELQGKEQ